MANLGASYPEAVAVLMTASNQKNLPGPLVFDALPAANKAYDMAQLSGAAPKKDDASRRPATTRRRARSSSGSSGPRASEADSRVQLESTSPHPNPPPRGGRVPEKKPSPLAGEGWGGG